MKKSSKISWARGTIEISIEDHKAHLWIHNKSIDEHLSIAMDKEIYNELLGLLEACKYDFQ